MTKKLELKQQISIAEPGCLLCEFKVTLLSNKFLFGSPTKEITRSKIAQIKAGVRGMEPLVCPHLLQLTGHSHRSRNSENKISVNAGPTLPNCQFPTSHNIGTYSYGSS